MCNFDLWIFKGLSCPVCREEFGGKNPSRNFLAEKVIQALNVLRADPNAKKRNVERNIEKVDAEKVVLDSGAVNVYESQNTESVIEVKVEEPDSENLFESSVDVTNELIDSDLPNYHLFESEMINSPENENLENNFENLNETQPGSEANANAEIEPEIEPLMKSENDNESEINLENNFPDFDEEKSKSQNWFWNVSSPILNIIWVSHIFQNCICYYFLLF